MDARFQEGDDSESPRRKDDGQALLRACLENDWKKAETLIKAGSFLGARCEAGRTPLMHACLKGKETVVQLLIDRGADPQVMDKRGDTCLHFLETLRNQTILQCILNEYQALGVSVDVESLHSECSPLSISCIHGAVNSAELLLKYGANPNGCENGKHRPLVDACTHGHVRLVKSLLIRKAKVNATGKNGVPPLLQACNNHHWVVAQVLVDEGADVNQCGTDCTSPLFAAVSANAYQFAATLIMKGANVNVVRFQPGAVEGIVEMSALAHAAGKGLKTMVKLLVDNGANVNYMCSDAITAVGCSILGEQFETFHFLLECDSLDKSILGLSSAIVTSVRTERYYFTERLLELLGGAKTAVMEAHQNHMEQLKEIILMYMQAVHHEDLPEVSLMLEHFKSPAVVPLCARHHPEDQHKIDDVLTKFCSICISAVRESPEIHHDSLAEIAQATGNRDAGNFFRRVLSSTMTPEEIRSDFLCGPSSPLRFLIENKILTIDIFQMEVLKFYLDGGDQFYKDLVWTFRKMKGGTDLPTNGSPSTILVSRHAMLTQLFSGRFVPGQTTLTRDSYYGVSEPRHSLPPIRKPAPVVSEQRIPRQRIPEERISKERIIIPDNENGVISKSFGFRGINTKLCHIHTDMSSSPSTCSRDSNTRRVSLPQTDDTNDSDYFSGSSSTPSSSSSSSSGASRSMPLPHNTVGDPHDPYRLSKQTPHEGTSLILPDCRVKETGESLGSGSFALVKEVEFRGKKYAAKIYHNSDMKKLLPAFLREIHIYANIRHENIVSYHGLCKLEGSETNVIVMERMCQALSTFLKDSKPIDTSRKLKILHNILQGLNHLHTRIPAIIHRDLTATNVLLDSKGVAKIGDFGNSRMVDLDPTLTPELMTSRPGTLDYMPPEALDAQEEEDKLRYTDRLDIFSFGQLSLYVMAQERPKVLPAKFRDEKSKKSIARSEIERRAQYINRMKSELCGGDKHPLYSIIVSCLQEEPEQRPKCSKILDDFLLYKFV